MKNRPEDDNLRRTISERGGALAVLGVPGGDALEKDAGIRLIRGIWDGEPAIAVIDARDEAPSQTGYEGDLKSLHDISFELSLCESVEDVCKEAVRLGRERLNFDRLGIWLVDQNDPRWLLGTWGVDEGGAIRDERGSRVLRSSIDAPSSFFEGRLPIFLDDDFAYLDQAGRTIGRGSKLLAPLWDGHQLIGDIGADDFLRHGGFCSEKREAFVIFARILGHLISLKRAEAELRLLASTDSLTGTVNRRTALIILEKNIAQCWRSEAPLTLCLADLDGLKIVNDAFGHAAGDEYICRASSALVGAVRGSDTVGRIGGDEFLVIFPDCRGDVVSTILERVNADLASGKKGARAGRAQYLPRLSWGIASLGEVSKDEADEEMDIQRCIDILLELADQRMYDNKRSKGASRPKTAGQARLAL
jgi:diguanylate cyclase (GGDEF)-like protein